MIKIIRAADAAANAAKNKLRVYPSAKRGMERLRPLPRPYVPSDKHLPEDAAYFVTGNCFARAIEKAMKWGGKRLLSSPYIPELPGNAVQQFQRFNIFNLDVATNEILWATQRPDERDDALIAVGDELVDMQLHFTVAYPPEEMKRIRRLYNASYAKVAEADVIIAVSAGVRQWFDADRGIYMNVQPTRRMQRDYEGRFELHAFEVEDIYERLRIFRDTVRAVNETALLMLAVSPVAQPSTFSTEDILVDQFQAQCAQTIAVQKFVSDFSDVEYIPSIETARLSDFRYTFLEHSPNHTRPTVGFRVIADMLQQHRDVSSGQQLIAAVGYGEALDLSGDFEGLLRLLEPLVAIEDPLAIATVRHMRLHRYYVRALMQLGRSGDALLHLRQIMSDQRYISMLQSNGHGERMSEEDDLSDSEDEVDANDEKMTEQKDHMFGLALAAVASVGSQPDHDFLKEYARLLGHDENRVRMLNIVRRGDFHKEVAEMASFIKNGAYADVISMADKLSCKRPLMSLDERRRVDTLTLQSYVKLRRGHEGIEKLIEFSDTPDAEIDQRTTLNLCNVARSHARLDQIDPLVFLARQHNLDDSLIAQLLSRKAMLDRAACRKTP